MKLYRKITIEIDEGNHIKHIEMSNEELLQQIKLNEELKQKVNNLQKENKELKDNLEVIDKAIEFIDKYCIDDEFYINLTYKEKAIIEVKKILQGSDKDVLD